MEFCEEKKCVQSNSEMLQTPPLTRNVQQKNRKEKT